MRMYRPKQSAELPFFTCFPATEQLGASTFVNSETGTFACFCAAAIFCCSPLIASISGWIPLGVMSGVPVMNSWLRFEFTVFPPLMASTIDATPKPISTTPAANPPICSAFFTTALLPCVGLPGPRECRDATSAPSMCRRGQAASAPLSSAAHSADALECRYLRGARALLRGRRVVAEDVGADWRCEEEAGLQQRENAADHERRLVGPTDEHERGGVETGPEHGERPR